MGSRADAELICRLSKSIACLSFNFVWTFLLKSRFQRLCLCLYLYLAELLSLNLYMTLLSFVMLLLNYVFSPIQQAQNIDVSISEFHEKKKLWKFTACVMFLAMCTSLWRCKLKPSQNGDLKKPQINFSRNIIHRTYATFISLRCFEYERTR